MTSLTTISTRGLVPRASEGFRTFSAVNGLLQLLLFTFVVCIPAWRTERMSYVDIGWPWGLVVIGVVTLVMGQGDSLRIAMVGGLYIFMGGRMGIFAVKLWHAGALRRELPRYQYQAVRWERTGETNIPVARNRSQTGGVLLGTEATRVRDLSEDNQYLLSWPLARLVAAASFNRRKR